jgi:hypothetical protein
MKGPVLVSDPLKNIFNEKDYLDFTKYLKENSY